MNARNSHPKRSESTGRENRSTKNLPRRVWQTPGARSELACDGFSDLRTQPVCQRLPCSSIPSNPPSQAMCITSPRGACRGLVRGRETGWETSRSDAGQQLRRRGPVANRSPDSIAHGFGRRSARRERPWSMLVKEADVPAPLVFYVLKYEEDFRRKKDSD